MNAPDLDLRPLSVPPPWEAFLVPAGSFPLPAARRSRVAPALLRMAESLTRQSRLQQHTLLQMWKLGPGSGAEELSRHMQSWSPEIGLGIWPDRDPPSNWDQERVSDATAAALLGQEIALPSHKLLRLRIGADKPGEAIEQILGFGALIQIYTRSEPAVLDSLGKQAFQPALLGTRFARARFLLPLLDAASLASAKDAHQLETWLCGADTYLRESPEDKAYLLVSRIPVSGHFQP